MLVKSTPRVSIGTIIVLSNIPGSTQYVSIRKINNIASAKKKKIESTYNIFFISNKFSLREVPLMTSTNISNFYLRQSMHIYAS